MQDNQTNWVGFAAVILATGVAVATIITAAGAAFHAGPISQSESNLLSTVLGAAVGAVAAFLGVRVVSRSEAGQPDDQGGQGQAGADTGDGDASPDGQQS